MCSTLDVVEMVAERIGPASQALVDGFVRTRREFAELRHDGGRRAGGTTTEADLSTSQDDLRRRRRYTGVPSLEHMGPSPYGGGMPRN